MNESKFGKYLLYALGEILLVVIGILIAVTINTGNQERKARNEEIVVLNNLQDDFKSAIEEFKTLNAIRTSMVEAAKELYEYPKKSIDNLPKAYIDTLLSKTLSAPTYNNQSGSLGVLLTSGKIDLITNKELKKQLISWPGDVDDMVEDEINQANLYYGKYSDLLDQYAAYNDIAKAFNWSNSRWRFEIAEMGNWENNLFISVDYEAMLSDPVFLNVLQRRSVFCQISIFETDQLIEKAAEIILMIQSDLKTFQ